MFRIIMQIKINSVRNKNKLPFIKTRNIFYSETENIIKLPVYTLLLLIIKHHSTN